MQTPLTELLGIDRPVLLAPMAGSGTPELAAAVTRAGGLGFLALTGMTAEAARDAVEHTIALAGGPIGINVLLAGPTERGDRAQTRAFLAPYRSELGLGEPGRPTAPPPAPPAELIAVGLDAGASVVSAALGDVAALAGLARDAGVPLLAMVGTAAQAVAAVAAGADAVIAQGAEAGGHRADQVPAGEDPPLVGTFALVPRVVDAVDVPVVAAGGIMDGRGLVAALALGAAGVSLGTRFLLAEEAGVPAVHQSTLLGLTEHDTVVTDVITGRPARWIRNRITADLIADGPTPLGWGPQRQEMSDIVARAGQAGRADLMPMLAGQGAGSIGRVLPAAGIVEELVRDADAVLARLQES